MKRIIYSLVIAFVLCSCQKKAEEDVQFEKVEFAGDMAMMSRQVMEPAPVSSAQAIEVGQEVNKQKIIKDGRMGVKVSDLEPAKQHVDSLIDIYAAYYSNESFNDSEFETSYNLAVRVPAEQFEKLISDLETGIGTLMYKEIMARDVTEQFIDLETRLESKKEYLARYTDLLKQAKTVKDILDIEERIRVLQEEIESTEGRLRYLKDQVAYSTLQLMISKEVAFKFSPDKRDRIPDRLKQALSKGWIGMIDLLLYLVKLWPIWLAIALIGVVRMVWHRNA